MTENMHSSHQPSVNINLNMQLQQIPGQAQHQQQNNGPFESVYGNLSNMSPDNNSENNTFYAHLS